MKIKLDLIRNSKNERTGLQLDVAYVMSRLIKLYPFIEFQDEYFLGQVRRIEKLKEPEDLGSALKIAIRDAEERGPGYKFVIELGGNGKNIEGTITRYSLRFDFEEDIPSKEKQKVEDFIRGFEISVTSHKGDAY